LPQFLFPPGDPPDHSRTPDRCAVTDERKRGVEFPVRIRSPLTGENNASYEHGSDHQKAGSLSEQRLRDVQLFSLRPIRRRRHRPMFRRPCFLMKGRKQCPECGSKSLGEGMWKLRKHLAVYFSMFPPKRQFRLPDSCRKPGKRIGYHHQNNIG